MFKIINHVFVKYLAAFCLVSLIAATFIYIPSIPMQSHKKVYLPWLENITGNHVLVFGGYPGCLSTCPIALNTLREVYLNYQLRTKSNDLQVVFTNILQNSSDDLSNKYAKSFHKDFIGVSIKSDQINDYRRSFSMQTFQAINDITHHPGYIYYLHNQNSQWHLKQVFSSDVEHSHLLKILNKHNQRSDYYVSSL